MINDVENQVWFTKSFRVNEENCLLGDLSEKHFKNLKGTLAYQ